MIVQPRALPPQGRTNERTERSKQAVMRCSSDNEPSTNRRSCIRNEVVGRTPFWHPDGLTYCQCSVEHTQRCRHTLRRPALNIRSPSQQTGKQASMLNEVDVHSGTRLATNARPMSTHTGSGPVNEPTFVRPQRSARSYRMRTSCSWSYRHAPYSQPADGAFTQTYRGTRAFSRRPHGHSAHVLSITLANKLSAVYSN